MRCRDSRMRWVLTNVSCFLGVALAARTGTEAELIRIDSRRRRSISDLMSPASPKHPCRSSLFSPSCVLLPPPPACAVSRSLTAFRYFFQFTCRLSRFRAAFFFVQRRLTSGQRNEPASVVLNGQLSLITRRLWSPVAEKRPYLIFGLPCVLY